MPSIVRAPRRGLERRGRDKKFYFDKDIFYWDIARFLLHSMIYEIIIFS